MGVVPNRGGPIGVQRPKRTWAKQLHGRTQAGRDAGLAFARHVHAIVHLLCTLRANRVRGAGGPEQLGSPREFGADRAGHRDDAHRRAHGGATTTRGRRAPLSSRGGAPPLLAVSHAPTGPTTRSPPTPAHHPAAPAAAARSLAARAPGFRRWGGAFRHRVLVGGSPTATKSDPYSLPPNQTDSFSPRDQPA
jgi:hypothetical protein